MAVYDVTKLRHRYVTSTAFKLDVVSLLPTDLVFFVTYESHVVIARLNRVLRLVVWKKAPRGAEPAWFCINILHTTEVPQHQPRD